MPELSAWDSFYLIVGGAAAALVGLQFVAIALIADRPVRRQFEASAAFASPTIVYFAVVLFLSALVRVPWRGIGPAAAFWGAAGLAGVVYTLLVARRMRRQDVYRPVFEDWVFHLLLPLAAYGSLAGSAVAAPSHPRPALFAVGGAVLLLLFVGIHNVWDAVTWHLFARTAHRNDAEEE